MYLWLAYRDACSQQPNATTTSVARRPTRRPRSAPVRRRPLRLLGPGLESTTRHQVGPRAVATAAWLNKELGLPISKASRVLELLGVSVSPRAACITPLHMLVSMRLSSWVWVS